MWARMKEVNDSLELIGEDYATTIKRTEKVSAIYSCNEVWTDWPVSLFLRDGIINWDAKNSNIKGKVRVRAFLTI